MDQSWINSFRRNNGATQPEAARNEGEKGHKETSSEMYLSAIRMLETVIQRKRTKKEQDRAAAAEAPAASNEAYKAVVGKLEDAICRLRQPEATPRPSWDNCRRRQQQQRQQRLDDHLKKTDEASNDVTLGEFAALHIQEHERSSGGGGDDEMKLSLKAAGGADINAGNKRSAPRQSSVPRAELAASSGAETKENEANCEVKEDKCWQNNEREHEQQQQRDQPQLLEVVAAAAAALCPVIHSASEADDEPTDAASRPLKQQQQQEEQSSSKLEEEEEEEKVEISSLSSSCEESHICVQLLSEATSEFSKGHEIDDRTTSHAAAAGAVSFSRIHATPPRGELNECDRDDRAVTLGLAAVRGSRRHDGQLEEEEEDLTNRSRDSEPSELEFQASDSSSSSDSTDMNYFRSRFQRSTGPTGGASAATPSVTTTASFLNPESLIRDYQRRRRERDRSAAPSSSCSGQASTSASSTPSTASSIDRSPSLHRGKANTTKFVSRPHLHAEDNKVKEAKSPTTKTSPLGSLYNAKKATAKKTESIVDRHLKEQQQQQQYANGSRASGAVSSLSKQPSLRRRRYPSDGTSEEAKPGIKKGNYSIEVELEQTVFIAKPQPRTAPESAKEVVVEARRANSPPLAAEGDVARSISKPPDEDQIDPLGFIEIKSAAQWKAMSGRISWNFDEEDASEKAKEPDEEGNKAPKRYNFSIGVDSKAISTEEGFMPTKVQQLRLICWKVKPWSQSRGSSSSQQQQQQRLFSSQFGIAWGVDCDEVYPGLFIGDKESASNVAFLQRVGVTHVLNAAEGKDEGLVDLSPAHYAGSDISYLGFPLWDCPTCNILPYLGCAAEYIANAIASGGKCLVNCQMGVSRSATCAMSYLMINKEMTAVEVLSQFRRRRDVRPNDGFMEQIVHLDNDLRRHRECGATRLIVLSSLQDHKLLPQAWNYEFWTKPVTEEEIGMPLVKLGEPCPIIPSSPGLLAPAKDASSSTSRRSSRALSRRSSSRRTASQKSSFRSNRTSPGLLSRRSSCRSSSCKKRSLDMEDNNEDEWEWVWEDDEDASEENEENIDPATGQHSKPSPLTTKKLELVKDIIEKPEDRWRFLWQQARSCDSPSSLGSSVRSFGSNLSNTTHHSGNIVQPGVEGGDPLSLVKVTSAKQWKEISKKLTINLEGITTSEEEQVAVSPRRPETPSVYVATTVQQLRLICWRVKPWEQPKPRNLFSSIFGSAWGVDCDEVYPSLFIGDEASARNIKFLQRMGITHVLNAAEGVWTDCSFVDLTAKYYEGSGITYQGLQIWDSTKANILPYLGCSNEFIAQAIQSGGKCLVHCQMGVSRSCTSAMAYLMISEGWDAADVMREFRKRRDVRPNDHFLAQIVQLDNDLRKERLFHIPRAIKLHTLADIPNLPKPWHHEFWHSEPDPSTLPFALSHMGISPPSEAEVKSSLADNGQPILRRRNQLSPAESKRLSVVSVKSADSSDWEWEYYTDEDDEEEEKQQPVAHSSSAGAAAAAAAPSIGCARDWKVLSEKISSGRYQVQEDYEQKADSATEAARYEPTTEKQLRLICWRVKPWKEKNTDKLFSSQFAIQWKVDCDEVFPNLFIGDAAAAGNIKFLSHLNITYVLNTAQGNDEGLVNLTAQHYDQSNITYKGFLMWDSAWFDVTPFLHEAVEFISHAMNSGARCLVNCQMGVSRSSTCALAYMMIKRGWKVADALRQFRTHRDVRPNDGFLTHLVTLDNKLRRQREGFT